MQKDPGQESNPGPSCCKGTVLPTAPLCSHLKSLKFLRVIVNRKFQLNEKYAKYCNFEFLKFTNTRTRTRRLPLIRDRVAGAADSAETPKRPSPQTPPPAPPGGAQGVPRPAERHSPSS
ncbi:hypothetical protein ILYODFUR_017050, partial [Ilyodon furcidens]